MIICCGMRQILWPGRNKRRNWASSWRVTMKLKYLIAWLNEFFDEDDDIRITVSNRYESLNDDINDIYPVITIVTPEESEDDGGYPILVASDLEEREEGYFEWSHRDITNFAKGEQ